MCTCPNYMIYNGLVSDKHRSGKKQLWKFIGHHEFDKLANGDYGIFKRLDYIQVPCGQCLECRLQYTRMWSDRCVIESKQYKYNYFITLTYDDDHLPAGGSLDFDDLTLFIKRLRKRFSEFGPDGKIIPETKIKYFACGEYGTGIDSPIPLRPHFHIILFNLPLDDLTFMFERFIDGKYKAYNRKDVGDGLLYSRTIYDLWHHKGIISIAPFSYDTAAYVAQYVTKKLNGKFMEEFKKLGLVPEGLRMSKGIGSNGFDKDKFALMDTIIVSSNGEAHISKLPRYYEKLYLKEFGELPLSVIKRRKENTDVRIGSIIHNDVNVDADNVIKNHFLKSRQKNNRKI